MPPDDLNTENKAGCDETIRLKEMRLFRSLLRLAEFTKHSSIYTEATCPLTLGPNEAGWLIQSRWLLQQAWVDSPAT
ncbi:hypothetical protein HOS54_gp211 [Klebsiella phage Menlow]|uniref:Uncharacterized protein n=1 Tax=Klebsiella phage Menlow TaxID=2054273 RepID=A0A2H5BN43_9CAUD|nr:hypothetical protein HOS54_gp211 [Klebsiella phage Menlow]AUG87738.1 hypothetical protein CPT_Menlow_037 [Klebsiella phage Menlow]